MRCIGADPAEQSLPGWRVTMLMTPDSLMRSIQRALGP
jgi:hypothetical protein